MSILFSDEHTWLQRDGDIAVMGITVHAQDTLGDIVFVDLPAIGAHLRLAHADTAGTENGGRATHQENCPSVHLMPPRMGHWGHSLPVFTQRSAKEQTQLCVTLPIGVLMTGL